MTLTIGNRTFTITPGEADLPRIGYYVTGARGARYLLIRNENDPRLLFATRPGGPCTIAGHEWFTDANGTVEPYTLRE